MTGSIILMMPINDDTRIGTMSMRINNADFDTAATTTTITMIASSDKAAAMVMPMIILTTMAKAPVRDMMTAGVIIPTDTMIATTTRVATTIATTTRIGAVTPGATITPMVITIAMTSTVVTTSAVTTPTVMMTGTTPLTDFRIGTGVKATVEEIVAIGSFSPATTGETGVPTTTMTTMPPNAIRMVTEAMAGTATTGAAAIMKITSRGVSTGHNVARMAAASIRVAVLLPLHANAVAIGMINPGSHREATEETITKRCLQ